MYFEENKVIVGVVCVILGALLTIAAFLNSDKKDPEGEKYISYTGDQIVTQTGNTGKYGEDIDYSDASQEYLPDYAEDYGLENDKTPYENTISNVGNGGKYPSNGSFGGVTFRGKIELLDTQAMIGNKGGCFDTLCDYMDNCGGGPYKYKSYCQDSWKECSVTYLIPSGYSRLDFSTALCSLTNDTKYHGWYTIYLDGHFVLETHHFTAGSYPEDYSISVVGSRQLKIEVCGDANLADMQDCWIVTDGFFLS